MAPSGPPLRCTRLRRTSRSRTLQRRPEVSVLAAVAERILLLLSGIVLWWPESMSRPLREAAVLVHPIAAILAIGGLIIHIYMGTAATPGAFRGMTQGWVSRAGRHRITPSGTGKSGGSESLGNGAPASAVSRRCVPGAREILTFYAGLAEWQGRVAPRLSSFDEVVVVIPTLLDYVKGAAPPALAQAAREFDLTQAGPLLRSTWEGRANLSMNEFFARAALQPYAASLPEGLDCPWCTQPPQAGCLRAQGDGLAFELVCALCLRRRTFPRARCPGCNESSESKVVEFHNGRLSSHAFARLRKLPRLSPCCRSGSRSRRNSGSRRTGRSSPRPLGGRARLPQAATEPRRGLRSCERISLTIRSAQSQTALELVFDKVSRSRRDQVTGVASGLQNRFAGLCFAGRFDSCISPPMRKQCL